MERWVADDVSWIYQRCPAYPKSRAIFYDGFGSGWNGSEAYSQHHNSQVARAYLGFKGIFIGSYIGIFIPAGPFSFMPIIASIYKAGAGVGPIIALYAGRAMLSLQILVVWQIPFLGVEIPLSRFLACLFLPPFVGLAGKVVYQLVSKDSKPDDDWSDNPDVVEQYCETDNI
jgi:uncharacterized membrane protein YraQ (UPF0718 family)